ncbi:nitroreductase family protein [Liberiplasma polymorphum]|uniref:nitroreductase family protein n=1 Tax=Liberiplasma polymorphum TaxID=3374570 RepID=UPI003774713B
MSLCMQRRSIRKYDLKAVEEEKIKALLKSAMQAPSARNQQPWEFFVIKNKEILNKLSTISRGAHMLNQAPVAILTVFKEDVLAPHMRPQDLAAASQNILLEATNQGLGAVWIGVYPLEERMNNIKEVITIPNHLTPFSLIAIGYPDEDTQIKQIRYDASRVHEIL